MNTLIIGANTGGIGDAVMVEIVDRWDVTPEAKVESGNLLIPTKEEFDVTSRHSVSRWFAMHEDMVFDQVVYSAGFNQLGMIGDLDKVAIREMFDINVIGFIRLLDHLIMHHRTGVGFQEEERSCSIVAVVSDSATTAMRGSIGYASSKAALAHAIRCAARELAPHYRVNGVAPAMVDDTDMTRMVDRVVPELRGWTEEETLAYERSLIPMGRRARKEEVARLVVDVLEGPEFMTGAVIPITGGK